MIDSLTKKQRQLLALAILALVVVTIFTLTIVPLWALNKHYLDTIDDLDSRLQILQRTASAGIELRTQHEQLKRSLASNRHYLKSTSEASAAANLQSVIKRIAGANGMEVLSTQILPTNKKSDFTRVALKVHTRSRLNNTVRVFHALETGQPYLFIENISVRGISRSRQRKTTGQVLNVDFDLIGYMLQQS